MNEEYPLFPELSEPGQQEAQALMDRFKEQMEKVCEKTLSELYTDVACYIESDSWTNYRNQLLEGFRNYDNRKVQGQHDFTEVRKQIYKEFRDELIPDLNQDLLKEIESLKQQIKWMEESRNRY